VLSVLKSWVETHIEDFKQDEELKQALLGTISHMLTTYHRGTGTDNLHATLN
jgi:hypothetical protein